MLHELTYYATANVNYLLIDSTHGVAGIKVYFNFFACNVMSLVVCCSCFFAHTVKIYGLFVTTFKTHGYLSIDHWSHSSIAVNVLLLHCLQNW